MSKRKAKSNILINLLSFVVKSFLQVFKAFCCVIILALCITAIGMGAFGPITLALDYHQPWAWFLYIVTIPVIYYYLRKLDEPSDGTSKLWWLLEN